MVGFEYPGKENFSTKYDEFIGKYVDLITSNGIYSGKLESLANGETKLNPVLDIFTNSEGWNEKKLKKSGFKIDSVYIKGMKLTTRKIIKDHCYFENMITRQEYFIQLADLKLIEFEEINEEKLKK